MNLSVLLVVALAVAPPRREAGSLVLDGVPDIPAAVSERTRQYQNVRSAVLLDWHPDGTALISTRFADTVQLHEVRAPMGARRQLTFFAEPVTAATYDPARPDAGVVLRMDQGGGEAYQYFWLERKTGRATRLTDGTSRHESLVMSRGGGVAAYSSTKRNGKDFDIWLMELSAPGKARRLLEAEGRWSPLAFSADGRKLLVSHFVSINESWLFLVDVASGARTPVNAREGVKVAYRAAALSPDGSQVYFSSDEAGECAQLFRLDLRTGTKLLLTGAIPWDVEAVELSPDGKTLAYVVNEGGMSVLYLGPAGAAGQRVTLPAGVVSGLRFTRDGRRLGFTFNGAAAPADVYAVEVGSRAVTRLTESEVGGLDPGTFVVPLLVKTRSFDGREIPAWFYAPRATTGSAPVIISVHGGPEAQSLAIFNPTVQYWVLELGAAVLMPNVRGSSGYGKTYLMLDNGEKREDAVKDMGAWLDWVQRQPALDATRVAITGGSYGGYMTLASLVHYPGRLACGVDVVGISNFVSFLENTETYRRDLRRQEYGDERDPAMRAFLQRVSPLNRAAEIKAPLFVVQGRNDPRVPASEAEQVVEAVRRNGQEVWYLLAKDEGHGFQKKANRDVQVDASSWFFSRCFAAAGSRADGGLGAR